MKFLLHKLLIVTVWAEISITLQIVVVDWLNLWVWKSEGKQIEWSGACPWMKCSVMTSPWSPTRSSCRVSSELPTTSGLYPCDTPTQSHSTALTSYWNPPTFNSLRKLTLAFPFFLVNLSASIKCLIHFKSA